MAGREDSNGGRFDGLDERATEAVWAFVRTIPVGKVVTYGQVAGSLESVALTARQVGMAMNSLPDDVPWQRVVGAGGTLPIGKRGPELKNRQRTLLEQEGVMFLPDKEGREPRVDMSQCQWRDAEASDGMNNSAQSGLFDDPTVGNDVAPPE